jgi:hypothetical protein
VPTTTTVTDVDGTVSMPSLMDTATAANEIEAAVLATSLEDMTLTQMAAETAEHEAWIEAHASQLRALEEGDPQQASLSQLGPQPGETLGDGNAIITVNGIVGRLVAEARLSEEDGVYELVHPDRSGQAGTAAPDVSWSDYESTKAVFEGTDPECEIERFYYETGNKLAEVNWRTGEVIMLDLAHARTALDPTFSFAVKGGALVGTGKHKGRQSFLDMWLLDPNRRVKRMMGLHSADTYHARSFMPRHLYFQQPFVLGFQRYKGNWTEEQEQDVLHTFDELLKVVVGGNDNPDLVEVQKYVLAVFAHILQRPLEIAETALAFLGPKGCGKDTLGSFFGTYVLGSNLFINYDDTKTYFEKHNDTHLGKLLIKLEEADSKVLHEFRSQFRARITTSEVVVNGKHEKLKSFSQIARHILTGNSAQTLNLNEEDMKERRFFITHGVMHPDGPAFFDKVYKTLMNYKAGAIVGRRFMELELGSFHPRQHPTTQLLEAQYMDDRSAEEQYVMDVWDGELSPSSRIYNGYTQWAASMHVEMAAVKSVIAFGKFLSQLALAQKLKTRSGRSNVRLYERPARPVDAKRVPGVATATDADEDTGAGGGAASAYAKVGMGTAVGSGAAWAPSGFTPATTKTSSGGGGASAASSSDMIH